MKMSRFALLLALLALSGCFGADSDPVSLPVPFTGALNADTTVLIAVGVAPVSDFPIQWETVDATTGSNVGDITFFSTTEPQVTDFPAGGPGEKKRTYVLNFSATLADGTEMFSNNFQCIEFPTDYPPNFKVADVVPNDPGAVAVVRKALCSGNNTLNGRLLDAKLLMGMVKLSNGDFVFHSQVNSPVFINGAPFLQASGPPDSEVVMTLLYQGGSFQLPPRDPYIMTATTPLSLPGSTDVIGTELLNFISLTSSPDFSVIDSTADVQFLIGNSSLIIKNSRALFHTIPELIDPVRTFLGGDEFADDLAINDPLLENGIVIFNSRERSQSDVINCDPAAGEAVGIFQELCQKYGGLRAQLMCLVYTDLVTPPPQGTAFLIEGAWVLLKP